MLKEPEMRREILNGISDDEKEAVKAFVDYNKESALKVKPKVSANLVRCFSTHDRIVYCRIHSKHQTPSTILIIMRYGDVES